MFLQPALVSPLALQTESGNSDWWWLFLLGLILLIAFLYWWRRVSEEDLETIVAFEKDYPQALAMPAGFVPPAGATAVAAAEHDTHPDHGHGEDAAEAAHADETAVSASQTPDNLQRIEGVGPKIAELLNAAGITTFDQLANTAVTDLQKILEEAGPRYQLADPASWPQQADLAAQADWTALEALQESLKGGRHTE